MAASLEGALNATFFETPAQLRGWLEARHQTSTDLWVGFYKKSSGRPSITWPEAVDEALCVGWIDGVRKGIDETRYAIRFTPRKPRSTWSAVNIQRVKELTQSGLMRPAGLRAYEQRSEERSAIYAYEQRRDAVLGDTYEELFRANPAAWDFFQTQPASYRRAATWWVISAKQEATKLKRLLTLIANSEQGRAVPPLTRRPKPQ